ncbi:HAD-IIB family hydrolase [Candidatus Dojkabacteria bacterium]|jgi:HAD superfamily hydrolase (TIGR01484 family)|nr:HAD-IIB family hydrolase [Candidatus Dojkabacteria bacterium]
MKKLLIFDYDKTIAPPNEKPSKEMHDELVRLLKTNYIAIMTAGRTYEQLIDLLVNNLNLPEPNLLRKLYLTTSYGNLIYEWDGEYTKIYDGKHISLEDKEYIMNILKKIDWNIFEIPYIYGEQIEDKGTSFSISCLGLDAPRELKGAWDPTHGKRKKIKEILDTEVRDDFDIYVTGRTSVDIVPKDKTKLENTKRLAQMLNIPLQDVIYAGDEFEPYGNDYPVLSLKDVRVIVTTGPEETLGFIKEM